MQRTSLDAYLNLELCICAIRTYESTSQTLIASLADSQVGHSKSRVEVTTLTCFSCSESYVRLRDRRPLSGRCPSYLD